MDTLKDEELSLYTEHMDTCEVACTIHSGSNQAYQLPLPEMPSAPVLLSTKKQSSGTMYFLFFFPNHVSTEIICVVQMVDDAI
jgi:hypothetical protein